MAGAKRRKLAPKRGGRSLNALIAGTGDPLNESEREALAKFVDAFDASRAKLQRAASATNQATFGPSELPKAPSPRPQTIKRKGPGRPRLGPEIPREELEAARKAFDNRGKKLIKTVATRLAKGDPRKARKLEEDYREFRKDRRGKAK